MMQPMNPDLPALAAEIVAGLADGRVQHPRAIGENQLGSHVQSIEKHFERVRRDLGAVEGLHREGDSVR